jgi:Protein of unknown function (DUF3047)
MNNRLSRFAAYAASILVLIALVGYVALQRLTSPPPPVNPVLAGAEPTVTLMDFAAPPALQPLTPGWWHVGFLTKPKMDVSFVEKDQVKALRCETNGSGSIFGRHTDIDLAAFPRLTWSWLIEQPVVATIPETESEGDDHPARFLLEFNDGEQRTHHMEIIWSNGAFKAGQWKYIHNFPHYVANGGDAKSGENTKQWFKENVNLLELYRTAFKRTDAPRLVNISIFCDTDETGTHSIAYFADVKLEKQ